MEYSVAYDVTLGGFRNWWLPVVGFVFIIISVQLIRFRLTFPWRIPPLVLFVFAGLSIFVTALIALGVIGGHIALASALQNGRCNVIEGAVSDFHPMPKGGHDKEWLIVGNQRFEYSDYMISAGFNNTASHGGPIRKNLPVRIHYLGNNIAKLEVAKDLQPSKPADDKLHEPPPSHN